MMLSFFFIQGYRKIRRMLLNLYASECSVVFFLQGMSFVWRIQIRVDGCVRGCKLMQGNAYISKDFLSAYLCCTCRWELDKFSSNSGL